MLRLLCLSCCAVLLATTVANATPAGLTDTTLSAPQSNPLDGPTTIAPILDTGRALVLEKDGAVRVLKADGTLVAGDSLALAACSVNEQGLLGGAVDPAFAVNGYIYLYYSRNAGNCSSSTGRFNRVSRFTMAGDTINSASETVLLDNMSIPAGNHNGGNLEFGPDGYLYVSVGDGGTNPRGSGPSAAQDLSLLNGKILRITAMGGVPADNPFIGAAGAAPCATAGTTTATSVVCTEIYAYGLRNPFRFAFDPNTSASRFFINDVGLNTWEEVDAGGPGQNYGWDSREGRCNTSSTTVCPATPTGFTDPLTVYPHSGGCGYVTAGAFTPNGLWAAAFDGGYLFADGGCGKIFLLTRTGTVNYADPFTQTDGVITDMAFITQSGRAALFYVTNATSEIHKITLPAPEPAPGTGPSPGADPATPRVRCQAVGVRGLLAATARTTITANHCQPRQVVVAMRDGRAVRKNGGLVRARSAARPRRSAGKGRRWTLRVERSSPTGGGLYPADTVQTIWVGWEATPNAVARNARARYL